MATPDIENKVRRIAASKSGKVVFLSDDFSAGSIFLKATCSQGHIWLPTAHQLISGDWCPKCKTALAKSIKAKIDTARRLENLRKRELAIQKKFVQISSEVSAKTGFRLSIISGSKIRVQCTKGHKFTKILWRLTPGRTIRCERCSAEAALRRAREPKRGQRILLKAKNIALKRGGRLLSEVYVDWKTPLKWACSRGHKPFHYTLGRVTSGLWCQICATEDRHQRHFASLQLIAQSRQGKVLSKSFSGWNKFHDFECAEGHRWKALGSNVLGNGTWCRMCSLNSKR